MGARLNSPVPPGLGSDVEISHSFCRDSGKPWQLWDSREPFPFRCCWGSLQLTWSLCGECPLLSPDLHATRFMG